MPHTGAAPGLTELYSYGGTGDVVAPQAWAWGMSQGISFGQCSWWNGQKGQIQFLDRYFDYIIRQFAVMMFKSCGNQGNGDGKVTTPCCGYNMTATGNVREQNNHDWNDDNMNSGSSYVNPIEGHDKPEVAAPGTTITTTRTSSPWIASAGSGTSYASPVTCGTAALLAETDSKLESQPEAVRALIMAGAFHNVEGAAVLSERDGTGHINAAASQSALARSQLYTTTLTPASFTNGVHEVTVSLVANDETRICGVWFSLADSSYSTDVLQMDLDMTVWFGNQMVASSASQFNPFEIVQFVPPATGDYTVRLQNQQFLGSSEPFALAWVNRRNCATNEVVLGGKPVARRHGDVRVHRQLPPGRRILQRAVADGRLGHRIGRPDQGARARLRRRDRMEPRAARLRRQPRQQRRSQRVADAAELPVAQRPAGAQRHDLARPVAAGTRRGNLAGQHVRHPVGQKREPGRAAASHPRRHDPSRVRTSFSSTPEHPVNRSHCLIRTLAALAASAPLTAQLHWVNTQPAQSPAARYGHAATDRGLMFGGTDGQQVFDDTWAYTGSSTNQLGWEPVPTTTHPPARYDHAIASGISSALTFGGRDANGALLADTWLLTGGWINNTVPWVWLGDWQPVSSTTSPSARSDHAMAYDWATSSECLLFGGRTSQGLSDETWLFSNGQWLPRTTSTTPPPREGHSLFGVLDGWLLLGGENGNGFLDDSWFFDGSDWQALPDMPFGGADVGGVFVTFERRRHTLVGGRGDTGTLSQVFERTREGAWLQQDVIGAMPPRDDAIVIDWLHFLPNNLWNQFVTMPVVFGGRDANGNALGDTWRLTPTHIPSFPAISTGCGPGAWGESGPEMFARDLLLGGSADLRIYTRTADVPLAVGIQFDEVPAPAPGQCEIGIVPNVILFDLATAHVPAAIHGVAEFTLAAPFDPALRGIALSMQALAFEPSSANGLSLSGVHILYVGD